MLEMLALRAGRPVPAALLYEGLWGQSPPPSAAKALHTYVSHLRRALPPASVVTTGGGYTLQVDPGSVDAMRFEQAVHQARQRQRVGDQSLAASILQEGLGLWRGRPCPDLTEHSWATAEVARWEELRRQAEEELMEVLLEMGEGTRLVGELEAAVAAEPLRERRWAQLLLAYYRAGRQADALRAFTRLRSTLAEELGVSPSPELMALEQKVLQQSPELAGRSLSSGAVAAPTPLGGTGPPPRPANSFVGRSGGADEVAKLVGERRLVTLAGTGGCGKTRLAQELAAKVAGRFPGGAYFVALAPLSDPGLVPVAVAEALGVRPQSGRPPAQVVAEVIGHRETLVVLDNCEHLVQAVAELAEGLLSGAPGLRVLATSREPLRIGGETVWRVPCLEVPPPEASDAERRGCAAVELFVDRALSARPALRLDEAAIATVADIVRHLDGMPLAIELAAARVAVLDLASILEHLSDRFPLLSGGTRTAPPRQQTLRAAVAWSYDLLSTREQELFCRLSVFPAGFGLEAALAVAGIPPEDTAEDLFALVSKSMVAIVELEGGPARYNLHETLRQFGAGRLSQASAERTRAAHAYYYLSLAASDGREPFGPDLVPWLKRTERDLDNLRAVFSYLAARPERHDDLFRALAALRRYWLLANRNREGFGLLERATAGTEPADPVLRAKALVTTAYLAVTFDAEASLRYAKMAGELSAQVGDIATVALAAVVVASVNGLAGRGDEAEGERALCLAREAGQPLLVCEGLLALALSTDFNGPHRARCRGAYEELLAIAEENGDIGFSFVAHNNLSAFGFADDDPEAARPHVERQIELDDQLRQVRSGWADCRLAELLYLEGEYRGSLVLHRRVFEWARRQDLPWVLADAAGSAATCVIALESDNVAAAHLYGFAQDELERAGFGDRYRGDKWVDADLEVLDARLGARLADTLADGAAMTPEGVGELLMALETRFRLDGHDVAAPSHEVGTESAPHGSL